MKRTAHDIITERIIALMESGTVPWSKPWTGGDRPMNLASGKAYRGINQFLLGCQAYTSPHWLTFKQCKDKGGIVKKGSTGTPIVFWSMLQREDKETGETKTIPMIRYYNVFNSEQCAGLNVPVVALIDNSEFTPIEKAESILRGYNGPKITHNEPRAYYAPPQDTINMPKKENFKGSEEYYSTLFHEMTHSTGHSSRLNRKAMQDICPFGSTNYSKEELIAEMGSSFLCGDAGIENKTIDNSAAYIKGWVKKFRDQPKMIIFAAAQAQKAVDFIKK